MQGEIYRYLADDHDRLDALFERATADPDHVDMTAYAEFRSGLLRHIGMEEKVLLPAATRFQGGRTLPIADRIRLDHGAITALLVPPPSRTIIETLKAILQVHNALEEQEGGMYLVCEQLAGIEIQVVLRQLMSAPEVPVHPLNPKPEVLEATRRAVERAGHRMRE